MGAKKWRHGFGEGESMKYKSRFVISIINTNLKTLPDEGKHPFTGSIKVVGILEGKVEYEDI